MPRTVDVTAFGAAGDGVTDDSAAINRAIAVLQPGDTLDFPNRDQGYRIGEAVLALPDGAALSHLAGIDHLAPPSGAALRVCANASGIISGAAGHVFDTGQVLYRYPVTVYAGNVVFPAGATQGLMVYMRPEILSVATVNADLTTVQPLADIVEHSTREGYFDPCLIQLEDGSFRAVYLTIQGPNSAIAIRSSTDGGRSWGHTQSITPADPTRQGFAEPFALRLKDPERVILCWLDRDRTGRRDAVHRTAFSDDGLVSVSIQTVVTPTSGPASAGHIVDNSRASIYELPDGTLGLLYSRKVGASAAEVWGRLLTRTGVPMSEPVRITTVPRVSNDRLQIGCDPIVARLRDGTFALYFSAVDLGAVHSYYGELHLMLSNDGRPESFRHDRTVILVSDVGGGYGRPWPVCLPNGDVALAMSRAAAGQAAYLVVARHYHVCA
ncbi:MAG TPA: glycosyl hydrolase family 28-related protein [Gemmatimonadaceae bacterium]|jgi:hypothetical protein|nr:glycosyl hydrolase family 28-related protein [Gemmatimonadaceae bacterium]